jgi:hypothetical protein
VSDPLHLVGFDICWNRKLFCKVSNRVVTSRDPNIRKQYNRVRNRVKKEVDKMRKEFELELSEKAKTNPKAIWS